MTELDPSARDELVSAYLDGEATPPERAQVEADPDLMERVQILSQISEMVRAPVAVDARLRGDQIAAALEASDTAPNVTSLAAPRKGRDKPINWIMSAAAVLLLIALAVPVLRSGSDDDDSAVATGAVEQSGDGAAASDSFDSAANAAPLADEASEELAETDEQLTDDAMAEDDASGDDGGDDGASADDSTMAEEAGDGGEVAAEEAPGRFVSEPLADLGDLVDFDDLAGQVDERRASDDDGETEPDPDNGLDASLCAEPMDQLIGEAEILDAGQAVVGGQAVVYALITELDTGGEQLLVLDATTCEPVPGAS